MSDRIAMLERQLAEAKQRVSKTEALMAENDRLKDTVRELRAQLREARGRAQRQVASTVELDVRHLEEDERWQQAADLLEQMADAAEDPARRKECLLRRARIQERQLADFAGARATYERVLGDHPFDDTARGSLFRVKRKLGKES